MRKRLTLATAGMIAAAFTVAGPVTPAHACHDDIFISENPIHNGICWTVHETGIEEKVEAYVQELYCIVTQKCS